MQIVEIFERRANQKRNNAMLMLLIAILVSITGMLIFLNQLSTVSVSLNEVIEKITMSDKLEFSEKESLMWSINATEIVNMVSRTAFLVITFFIAQIFLKLYRHNMNLSDFYFSCCDAWKLNEEVEQLKKKENYVLLLKALYPSDIKLDIPSSPDFASLANALKKG